MHEQLMGLADRQKRVAARNQLAALGVGRDGVRTNVRAGRWTSLGPKVVVLHNGPMTRQQREWAALLAAGPNAGLAGRTSLALGGLRGWEDHAVHVLAPRGSSPRRARGIKVVIHETRVPASRQLELVGVPRRTPTERSAIDAGGWSGDARTAVGLVAAVVQQRLSTGPRLLQALDAAGSIRFRGILRLALYDISGGAQALSEIDFGVICRKYRLGRLIRQAVRLDASGQRRYLDAIIESETGAQIACEVDGALHLIAATYWQDMSRANELVIAGQPVLRFPTLALRTDEAGVADQIRRALAALDASASRARRH